MTILETWIEAVKAGNREDVGEILAEAADHLRWTPGFEGDADAELQRAFDDFYSGDEARTHRGAGEIARMLALLDASGCKVQ